LSQPGFQHFSLLQVGKVFLISLCPLCLGLFELYSEPVELGGEEGDFLLGVARSEVGLSCGFGTGFALPLGGAVVL
jgi:hypothetical protein